MFVITGDFQLKISQTGLELGFDGTLDLGGFATLSIEGGAVCEDGVFASYAQLSADIDVAGINISGSSTLEINSGDSEKTVLDASKESHTSSANTFQVTVDATLDLFGVLNATGTVT